MWKICMSYYTQQNSWILLQNHSITSRSQSDKVSLLKSSDRFKGKSVSSFLFKNGYELIKRVSTVSNLQNQSSGRWKRKMNLCYTIKIARYGLCIFPLAFLLLSGILFASNGFWKHSYILGCRNSARCYTLNGHRKKLRRLFIDLKIPIENEKQTLLLS